jgi:hypothetical protein
MDKRGMENVAEGEGKGCGSRKRRQGCGIGFGAMLALGPPNRGCGNQRQRKRTWTLGILFFVSRDLAWSLFVV